MQGEPGCFGWNGYRCVALHGACPGREECHFYKPAGQAEKERLRAYESSGEARERYERYDKKYWLMQIGDEFITENKEAILRIFCCRDLAKRLRRMDAGAVGEARMMLEEEE